MRVTTIGTCRVNNPCAAGARLYPYELCNQALYGFVHSTTEILQQIRHMRGAPIPEELAPLISDRLNVPTHGGADCYLVEISSRKSIKFGDYYLQQNQIERCFSKRPELWSAMRTFRRPEMKEQRLDALNQLPAFKTVTDVERRFLTEGQVDYQTEDAIELDMAKILEELESPVIFVTHCNVPGRDGKIIADRARTVDAVERGAKSLSTPYYNPTNLVLEHGVSFAMTDVNHYSDQFQDILASKFYGLYFKEFSVS
jgi:hypothetical protein